MNDQMLSGAGTIIAIVAAQLEMLHRQCSSLPTQPPAARNIYMQTTTPENQIIDHEEKHRSLSPSNQPL